MNSQHDSKKKSIVKRLERRFNNLFVMLITKASRQFTKMFYRLTIEGKLHVPTDRGALLIANHVSFVDFLLITHALPPGRRMYGVVDYFIYIAPFIRWFLKYAEAIPITSSKLNHEVKEQAFIEIQKRLEEGEIVLFFPEGTVTYDGETDRFQRGLERIKKEVPNIFIIPVSIDGVVGGFFSRVGGLFKMSKLLREPFRKVTLTIAPPVPASRWNLSHFETKVKLMLDREKKDCIECEEHLSLPGVRTEERVTTIEAKGKAQKPTMLIFKKTIVFNLLDASENGLCIKTTTPLEPTTTLTVSLENFHVSFHGEVKWCEEISEGHYKVGLAIDNFDTQQLYFEADEKADEVDEAVS